MLAARALNLLRFQDVGSYLRGIRFDLPELEHARFQSAPESGINHFFEYEKGLDERMRCSLRTEGRPDKLVTQALFSGWDEWPTN